MENRVYNTVEAYIGAFPPEIRKVLEEVRAVICKAAPMATEKISWGMPTYHFHENLVHFAAAKKHVGLYPSPAAVIHFADKLTAYKTSKGAIQFPFSKPIPLELIEEITLWRVAQVEKEG